jgi:two-component system, LuxR family, response regulator FixJ
MNPSATVCLVTDDSVVRESLRSPLVRKGFDVRAYDSPQAFLGAISWFTTGCVLIDIDMADGAGFGLLAEIHRHHLALAVIVITAHANCVFCTPGKTAPANKCLKRPFEAQTLLAVVGHALMQDSDTNPEAQAIRVRLASLSKRENEILAGLLQGQVNKAIAHELGISRKTVEARRANLMAKMRARSLAQLQRMSLAAEER